MAKTARADIAQILATQSLGKVDSRQFAQRIASYLLSTGRTNDVEPLLRDIMQIRADQGIVEVTAVSAYALTSEVKSNIETQVRAIVPSARQIIISEELRPTMLGGVRLELPNQQFDLSVRAKLSRFKQLTTASR